MPPCIHPRCTITPAPRVGSLLYLSPACQATHQLQPAASSRSRHCIDEALLIDKFCSIHNVYSSSSQAYQPTSVNLCMHFGALSRSPPGGKQGGRAIVADCAVAPQGSVHGGTICRGASWNPARPLCTAVPLLALNPYPGYACKTRAALHRSSGRAPQHMQEASDTLLKSCQKIVV